MSTPVRVLAGVIILAAVIGFGWVFSLPDKVECVASGRVVDPTERHCESGTGYQQLQEHALFHSRDVALGTGVLIALGYAVYRFRRRRAHTAA
jgi:hypothetical protein